MNNTTKNSENMTNQYRLPAHGEKVLIRNLVKASQHNGKQGIVRAYDPQTHRYRVVVIQDGDADTKKKQYLALKSNNILVLDDKNPTLWNIRLVHLFVSTCHINLRDNIEDTQHFQHQLELFRECCKSLVLQTGRCRIFVGVNGIDKKDNAKRHEQQQQAQQSIIDIIRNAAALPKAGGYKGHQWFVVQVEPALPKKQKPKPSSAPKPPGVILPQQPQNRPTTFSQFQHYNAMFQISKLLNPNAWIMFVNGFDMSAPFRIEWFQRSAAQHDKNQTLDGFYCGAKLLIDDELVQQAFQANSVIPLQFFVKCGDDGIASSLRLGDVVKDYPANMQKGTLHYFDYCVRSKVFEQFLSLTPQGVRNHHFCDLRFVETLQTQLNITRQEHPTESWLLMHYHMLRSSNGKLDMNDDDDDDWISDKDFALSYITHVEPDRIAECRNACEKVIIRLLGRNTIALEEEKTRLVEFINTKVKSKSSNYTDIGTRIWVETKLQFLSHFDEDILTKNQEWYQKLSSKKSNSQTNSKSADVVGPQRYQEDFEAQRIVTEDNQVVETFEWKNSKPS